MADGRHSHCDLHIWRPSVLALIYRLFFYINSIPILAVVGGNLVLVVNLCLGGETSRMAYRPGKFSGGSYSGCADNKSI
jgi:hypothetical protein